MTVCPILNSDVNKICPNCKPASPNTIPPQITSNVRTSNVLSGLNIVISNSANPSKRIKISILQSFNVDCKLGGQKK